MAQHRGKFPIELRLNVSDVLPLIGRDGNRSFNGMVNVGGNLVLARRMRKIAHGTDDLADSHQSLERLLDSPWHLIDDKCDIAILATHRQDALKLLPSFLEESAVVAQVVNRCIMLVAVAAGSLSAF